MSWKSLVTTALLCIVASPAFAVPNLTVSSGGLDTNGNWIWNATITPTTTTSPVAAELGFRETVAGSQLLSASKGTDYTGANTDNPGTQIFTWEVLTDLGGGNMKPVGLQTNCAAGCTVNGSLDEVFAALGSIADVTAASQYVQIITSGPLDSRLTTSLDVLGKYATGGGAGTNGRIAEITSGTNATNYNNFAGSASRTVVVGDLDLVGSPAVDIADFSTLVGNLNVVGSFNWKQGDVNGTTGGTEVDISDFSALVGCLNSNTAPCNTTANTPLNVNGVSGAGASLGAVPEPATVALAGLAVLGGLGIIRRRR